MNASKKRGRPRLYALCTTCQKPIKPDNDAGNGAHQRCPKVRGAHQEKTVQASPDPVVHNEPVEDSDQKMMAAQDEAVIRNQQFRGERRRRGRMSQEEKRSREKSFAETKMLPGQSFSARDVEKIIRVTSMNPHRHVIKRDGKYHVLNDPDIGHEGAGFETPGSLLMEYHKTIGVVVIGDTSIYWIGRPHVTH